MIQQAILILSIAFVIGNAVAFRSRIINGYDARIEDYPYQVMLFGFEPKCGGSIISEKHILTARHCIRDDMVPPYKKISIRSGTSYRLGKSKFHKISNITVHPNYTTDGNRALHDIAVITLKNPITFNKYRQKINLPERNVEVGQKAIITGWGSVQQIPTFMHRNQLQKLETEIISREECQKKMINPKTTIIYDTEICTTHKGESGVCYGDSGSPLASNGEVIGIVSWGDGDYCTGTPDVFTNVYKYKDFILSIINN